MKPTKAKFLSNSEFNGEYFVRFLVTSDNNEDYNVFFKTDVDFGFIHSVSVALQKKQCPHHYYEIQKEAGEWEWELFLRWADNPRSNREFQFVADDEHYSCYLFESPKQPHLSEKDFEESCEDSSKEESQLQNISMLVLGGFVALLGAALVAIALTVLAFSPIGLGLAAAAGAVCLVGGLGLFGASLYKMCSSPEEYTEELLTLN
jgi:hypothetical protein